MTLTGFHTDHRPAGWCGASPERWFTAPVHPVPSAAVASDLDPLEQHLVTALRALSREAGGPPAPDEAQAAWRAQAASRAIDHAARWLQEQRLGFYTIGSAGHESNACVALALRPDRPGAAALPLGRLLPRPRRSRPGRDGVGDVLLGHGRGEPTSRSPAAGTRCSATTTSRSSRRPRRSPRTCRAPSAWRSPSTAARKLGVPIAVAGRRVVVCSSATPRSTTRRRRPRSTPRPALRAPAACRCRCCSSARTTASGSACRRRAGWVEQSLRGRPELRYVEPSTATDPAAVLDDAARARRAGSASTGGPRSCTCAPCATAATPAPTWRPRIARRPGDPGRRRARPAARHRRAAGRRRALDRRRASSAADYLAVRARVRERGARRDGAAAAA